MERESCPLCFALPADWVEDPHQSRDFLFLALADLRIASGVGDGPMLSELPSTIKDRLHRATQIIAALKDFETVKTDRTVYGKDAGQWRYEAMCWLTHEPPQ